MIDMNEKVLTATNTVLPPEDLPRLLWWVGCEQPEALWIIQARGRELADEMLPDGPDVDAALHRWLVALETALRKFRESETELGPRPIWAFWSNFTRKGEPESPLAKLLREEVGYPSDHEAGVLAQVPGGEL